MSEYARRNLVCSSWHKCPDGWWAWGGNNSGVTHRPFCNEDVGHVGDHTALICFGREGGTPEKTEEMTWPNTLRIPAWLIETTMYGLKMLRAHVYERDQTLCERLDFVLDELDPLLMSWPNLPGYEDDDDDD